MGSGVSARQPAFMATKELFSAKEVIDESLSGFSDEALGDVMSAAERLLQTKPGCKENAEKCEGKVFLPPPLCVSPTVMICELMPLLDDSSLKHALANAKRLTKTRQKRKDLPKNYVKQNAHSQPKLPVAGGASDMDVFQLLAGMADESARKPKVCRPEMRLTHETGELDVFWLLAGMVGEPFCAHEPVHAVTVDWDVWQLLEGMANEFPPRCQKFYNRVSAAANRSGSWTAEQEKRHSTVILPCAEEKTLLRHALRHSRRRPFKEQSCPVPGEHILLTAASATIAYSPKEVAAYILKMHKTYQAATPKPAPMPPPPSPKHCATLSPRMFRQPGGRYGHVRHVARAF